MVKQYTLRVLNYIIPVKEHEVEPTVYSFASLFSVGGTRKLVTQLQPRSQLRRSRVAKQEPPKTSC